MKKKGLIGVALLLFIFQSSGVPAADRVVVVPLNSCNDPNLIPENICLGVTICGVEGVVACSLEKTYGTVISAGGRIWMDRNLGASQVATSSTDTLAYGYLYQWGRLTDGHEKRTSATTTDLSSNDVPGHASFILAPNAPFDWRNPQNNNLWQGVSGINNPCPAGFRLPTSTEWETELNSWNSKNSAGAFASPLKLVVAGYRTSANGSVFIADSDGFYWSSTVSGTDSRYLTFNSSNILIYSSNRAHGFSVRCLKD